MPLPTSHHLRAAALFLILGFATALTLAYAAAIFSPVMPPARGPQLELIEPIHNDKWRWMLNHHQAIGHTCMVFRRANRYPPGSAHPIAPIVSIPDALPYWSTLPSRGMKVERKPIGCGK
jgi:hypothetical protein